MTSPGRPEPRDAAWLVVAAAIFALLALAIVRVFMTPENMMAPTFGTAWAPYSDALGPWLDGGLAYLFGFPLPTYIYRPTIGLFWASILAASGRVELIPILFAAWLFVLLAAVVLASGNAGLRNALVVGLGICALRFGETWGHLFISSTAVDFPSLVLTISGAALILVARGRGATATLLAGSLCLGVAAAVRGPMMLAGPLMIAIRVLFIERVSLRTIVAAAFLFLVPLAIDVALQKYVGVINNGLMALYCAYSDPSHAWSPACNTEFLARKPAGGEVVRNFLAYLLSADGLSRLSHLISDRIGADFVSMHQVAALALIFTTGALAQEAQMRAAIGSVRTFPLARAIVVILFLGGLRAFGGIFYWSPMAWVGLAIAVAVTFRLWRAALCLSGYAAATLYLCMVGFTMDRLQHTFTLLLFVGIALLVFECSPTKETAQGRATIAIRRGVAIAVVTAIAFLYAGNFATPSQLRDTYLGEVHGKGGIALKIADDPRIDRSLYYSGDRQYIYTRHDGRAVGTVRKYRKLATEATSNQSFREPNTLLD